jgi:ABC transport system ATP-binding/permease protein
MLDRVSTHVLGLDGDGTARVYADTQQWEQSLDEKRPVAKTDKPKPAAAEPASIAPKKKLSYKEQREWDTMETRVLEAEETLTAKQAAMDNPSVNTDPQKLQQALSELHAAEAEVAQLYERWAELEASLA